MKLLSSAMKYTLILVSVALPNVVLGDRHNNKPVEDEVTSPPYGNPSTAPTDAPSAAPSSIPSETPSSVPSAAPSSSPSSAPTNTETSIATVPEDVNDLTVCKCDAAQRCDDAAHNIDNKLRLCFMTSPLMESSIERIDDLYLRIPDDTQEVTTKLVVDNVIVGTGASMRCSSNNDICQVLTPLNEDLFSNNNSILYARGIVVLKTMLNEETAATTENQNDRLKFVEVTYDEEIQLTTDSTDNLDKSSSSRGNRGLIFGLVSAVVAVVVFLSIAAGNKWLAMTQKSDEEKPEQQNQTTNETDDASSSPSNTTDSDNNDENV